MSKKLIIIASAIIGVLVLLLLVLWIMSLFSHKYYTYEQVEAKMVEATEKFYKNNPEILPVNDGRSTLSYNTLVENEFIKPLNELLRDGDSCTAEMGIIKNENEYTYIPKLVCSDKYATIELADHIINNNEVVTEGSGLYSDGQGGYYYKGKIDNNYVTLGSFKREGSKDLIGILWQIISIDKDGSIKVRALYPAGKAKFDNRYNETQGKKIGYNDFEMSLLKEKLKEIEKGEEFLTNDQKAYLMKSKLCIGKRSDTDTSKDGSTECSTLTQDDYLFGLLYPYEYMRGSLDNNCKNMFSQSCQNYNFLSGEGFGSNWTTIASPTSNYEVYQFDGETYSIERTEKERSLFVTAKLIPYTIFKSGDGTRDNPYKLIN